MRYSILGFNQQKLVELQTSEITLNMTDILLMDYIQNALSQPSMIKTMIDNQTYVWLNHGKILQDLPILNIKENMLRKHFSKLEILNLIKSINLANEHGRGSRTYYTITDRFESLQFTDEDRTSGKKLPVVDVPAVKNYSCSSGPAVKNYSSNNKLISIDNKLNNDNKLKDNTQKVVEEIKNLYNSHCTNLPKIAKLTDKRIKAIGSLLKKYSIEEITQVFDIANESDFLMGKNDRGWKADLDFILREDKFINILEGKYGGHRKINRVSSDMGRTANRMTDDQKKQLKEDIKNGRAEKY